MIPPQSCAEYVRQFKRHVPHLDIKVFQLEPIPVAVQREYPQDQAQSGTGECVAESVSDCCQMSRGLNGLATIASMAPWLALLITVMGIVGSFSGCNGPFCLS